MPPLPPGPAIYRASREKKNHFLREAAGGKKVYVVVIRESGARERLGRARLASRGS